MLYAFWLLIQTHTIQFWGKYIEPKKKKNKNAIDCEKIGKVLWLIMGEYFTSKYCKIISFNRITSL